MGARTSDGFQPYLKIEHDRDLFLKIARVEPMRLDVAPV
jgi:hypothetical protein